MTTKKSQAQVLQDAFLALDDPLSISREDLKEMVIKSGHKAGSIAYYVNAYSLAIRLAEKLSK